MVDVTVYDNTHNIYPVDIYTFTNFHTFCKRSTALHVTTSQTAGNDFFAINTVFDAILFKSSIVSKKHSIWNGKSEVLEAQERLTFFVSHDIKSLYQRKNFITF